MIKMRNDFLSQQLHRAANVFRLHAAEIQPENKMPAIHAGLVALNQADQVAGRAKPQLISLFKALHNMMTVSIVMLVNEIALQGLYSCMPGSLDNLPAFLETVSTLFATLPKGGVLVVETSSPDAQTQSSLAE